MRKQLLSPEQRAQILSAITIKRVLTFEEGCIYTGRSESDMYKRTSRNEVPHSKPNGKMIYFDREALEDWMLGNPIKTASQIEREATTHVTISKQKAVFK